MARWFQHQGHTLAFCNSVHPHFLFLPCHWQWCSSWWPTSIPVPFPPELPTQVSTLETSWGVVPIPGGVMIYGLRLMSNTVRSVPKFSSSVLSGWDTHHHSATQSLFLLVQVFQNIFNRLHPAYGFILFRLGLCPALPKGLKSNSKKRADVWTGSLTLCLLQLSTFLGPQFFDTYKVLEWNNSVRIVSRNNNCWRRKNCFSFQERTSCWGMDSVNRPNKRCWGIQRVAIVGRCHHWGWSGRWGKEYYRAW